MPSSPIPNHFDHLHIFAIYVFDIKSLFRITLFTIISFTIIMIILIVIFFLLSFLRCYSHHHHIIMFSIKYKITSNPGSHIGKRLSSFSGAPHPCCLQCRSGPYCHHRNDYSKRYHRFRDR